MNALLAKIAIILTALSLQVAHLQEQKLQSISPKKLGASTSLPWTHSAAVNKYDTASGNIENNQYASATPELLIINENGKIDYQPSNYLLTRLIKISTTTTPFPIPPILTEVHQIGLQYYDAFRGLDGKEIRVPITKLEYDALNRPRATARKPIYLQP